MHLSDTLTAAEIVAISGASPQAVWNWGHRQPIKYEPVPGYRGLYVKATVLAFLRERETE